MSKHTIKPRATRARTNAPSQTKHATTPAPDQGHLDVEWWPTERPVPYARNPRRAPEAAVAKVAASLAEYGWRQPIVVDEAGVVVAGHTRLLAAQRLGLEKVPVHVASDLSPAQVKAYRLADNRSSEETSWDYELLPLEIGELAALDYDISVTGFDPDEVAEIMATPTRPVSARPRTHSAPMGKASGVRDGCARIMDALADEALPLLVAERRTGLIRALSQVKPKARQAEIYDTDHELSSHPLDALRYLLVNLPQMVTDWDLGPPTRGIASGMWGRVW